MDDAMFSELSNGLDDKKFMTPIASTMIKTPGMTAEPAQVMVLMPGTRAEKAENALSQLKSYIAIASTCFVIGVFMMLYFWFRSGKKPEYAGKTLPGIASVPAGPSVPSVPLVPSGPLKSVPLSGPSALRPPQAPTAPQAPQAPQAPPAPRPEHRITFEDIVPVEGRIPIWDTPEESVAGEKRVSENDESIANIIKAREALTKDIESYMSTGLKT